MTPDDPAPVDFECKPADEGRYISEIVRSLLLIQASTAAQEKEPLARGTHAKGSAAHAEFEVLDVYANGRSPALAARLAQGIFAHPGKYRAVVRFANALSAQASDANPDVRAMSFSVDVPDKLLGPGATRADFSLNSATTFPMNDAHAFASFILVMAAPGVGGKLKLLLLLPLKDVWGFLKVAFLGVMQQRRTPKVAYQQQRYWSTTPFQHGPEDAAKYSATPNPLNPSKFENAGFNCLQDELARHVNEDARMSEWDFGVQFLDTERMTRFGRRRPATFWVENAAVEWREDQAPFHPVARLRLLPKAMLTPEETAAQYIDVTGNSTPDTRPLGGTNRARWFAERASRSARLDGVVDMPAAIPIARPWWARWTRRAVVTLAALYFLAYAGGLYYRWESRDNVPPLEPVDKMVYLNQGWDADGAEPQADTPGRQTYYYTAQGASLLGIRYSWFLNLERPFRLTPLRDPDHMRQLNFIVDPEPTRANPDQLPVGLAKYYDTEAHDYLLDLTCAACHTGQLHVVRPIKPAPAEGPNTTTTALRIDGGQAMFAVLDIKPGSFAMEMGLGLVDTLTHPFKFNRFANGVLRRDNGIGNKIRLWLQVAGALAKNAGSVARGGHSSHYYPTQEGYGRTSAIGRISNIVFGDHLDPANYRMFPAPESYPYLWNIWKFDWEQYGAFVAQPMARNVAESLGTGATFHFLDDYGRPVPAAERYLTSFQFENVQQIESDLRSLRPPEWPQDLLGPIDLKKATAGRELFETHCAHCHAPDVAGLPDVRAVAPGKVGADGALPVWKIAAKPLDVVGTDPSVSEGLVGYRLDLRRMGLDPMDVKQLLEEELKKQKARYVQEKTAAKTPDVQKEMAEKAAYADRQIASLDQLDLRSVSIGEALNIVDMVTRRRYYTDNHFSEAEQACFNGFGMLDLPQVVPGYKPRPLEGVWATPPYLHNGSVPTLYDLLSPADKRPRQFYVGRREYDAKRVGYLTALTPAENTRLAGRWDKNETPPGPWRGEMLLDTSLPGNSNHGHEFDDGYGARIGVIGEKFTEEQKWDLIEYLKIHRDDLDAAEYMEKNGGQYPPPLKYNAPDCSVQLAKRP